MSDAPALAKTARLTRPFHLPLVVGGLLVLTFALRAPGLGRPLVGNFATKSVVYAMMVRNWAEGRTTLWYPMIDCIVGGRRSYHMAEFPVSAYLTGLGWRLLGGSLDVWGRATAVAFSVAAVGLLFAVVRRRHGPSAAVGAALTLALSPVAVIYGQNFMLDASMLFFAVAALDAVDRHAATGRFGWLLLGAVWMSLLALSKFYLAVWLLPLGAMLLRPAASLRSEGMLPCKLASGSTGRQVARGTRLVLLGVAALVALAPAIAWYGHVYRAALPESPLTAHLYTSLQRNAAGSPLFDRILASPDFYRQVLDDLTGVLLTPIGFAIFLAGLLDRQWRDYVLWLVAVAVVVTVMPVKFYKMNYYYVALLPPLCILAGLGWQVLGERLRPSRRAVAGLLVLWLALSLRFALRPAFVTPPEDRAVAAAGRATQQFTVPDEPIATMHGDGIALLYYCDRPGWALSPDTPELAQVLSDCQRQGARYLVVADSHAPAIAARCGEALDSDRPVAWGEGYGVYRLARR